MADENVADAKTVSFSVKASNDQKFNVSVPDTITVLELKEKLSTSEYADLPAERQRLIYSGRVLKDTDKLSTYSIKDGNTVHMVKGAAGAQRRAPTSSSGPGSAQQNPAAAGVPQNIASGTGGDPLANLTGARYAGFAQMPGANTFGADGGMGAPPGPDDLLSMLDNPMFQSQMNEAMNNPDVIRMMTNNPMIQQNPMLRNALQNPEFRRMLMDPQVIRSSMQMSRMMGGQGQGQGQNVIAPGVTDTTPEQRAGNNTSTQSAQQATNSTSTAPQFNPFQFMGQGQNQGSNPFAALFGGGMGGPAPTGNTNNSSNQNTSTAQGTQDSTQNSQQQQQANPFASLLGGGAFGGQQQQQNNPFNNMMQSMMNNPQLMQQAMQDMQNMYGGGQNQQGQQGQQGGGSGFNPFAMLGQGGLGASQPPQAQQDSRPPEEQYADQLRQLNEMGFYEFDRNVRALRMAGGSVQGAVEMLLGGGV